ncbi:MAG: hypothetical protein R3F61_25885 [Myxococcota bacterium]
MIALSLAPAWALQLDVPLLERCERAPVVAVVEVTSDEVRWTDGPRAELETRTWLHVHEVLKGRLDSDTVETVSRGGTLRNGLTQRVEDEATWALDGRYVVFLAPAGDRWRTWGGELGQLRIDRPGRLEAVLAALDVCLD